MFPGEPDPQGERGPIDSLRWEVFSGFLQDYAILQTAGTKHDEALLSDLKSYKNFPKNEEWIEASLRKVLGSKTVSANPATSAKP